MPELKPVPSVDEDDEVTEIDFVEGLGFDADAAQAQKAEAEQAFIPVRLGGKVWPFPMRDDWPTEAAEAANRGEFRHAIELLFPDSDDMPDLLSKLDISVSEKLIVHVMKKSGVDQGKSNRSGNPSRRGRKR